MRKTFGKLSAFLLSLVLVISMAPSIAVSASESNVDYIPVIGTEIYVGEDYNPAVDEVEVIYLTNEITREPVPFNALTVRNSALYTPITLDATAYEISIAPMEGGLAYFNAEIAPLNTNPNIAITLNDSHFGVYLNDLANHQQRWYNFVMPANRIINVRLWYSAGIYDLVLFRLNGSVLEPVAQSIDGGGYERIRHLTRNGGVYFLAVAPFIPAPTPQFFTFRIDISSNFDQFEMNDYVSQINASTTFANAINIQANLDNPYDIDWFRLNVTTAGNFDITLSNTPTGNHYAIFIYDSNMNVLGSFFASGSAVRRINLPVGHYFIEILSLTGHVVSTNYRLQVARFVPPPPPPPQRPMVGNPMGLNQNFTSGSGYIVLTSRRVQAGSIVEFSLDKTVPHYAHPNAQAQFTIQFAPIANPNAWSEWTSFTTAGSGRINRTIALPYRQISVPGQPLWQDVHVRVVMHTDGSFHLFGQIATFGPYR